MLRLVDTHAHLDFQNYDLDREATIARARDVGLVAIINVGTDLGTSRESLRLAEGHCAIWAAVGFHPHDARLVGQAELSQLRELAAHRKVVAIGEIGLDYYRDLSPRADQRRAFVSQLTLAAELGKPVVVHSRDAHKDVAELLGGFEGRVVLHSYSGGLRRLDRALDAGYFISISGPITFRNANDLREVAAAVPLERLLVETDCPFLTPEPHRGSRNEPSYVHLVAGAVARARNMPLDALAQHLVRNAGHVFGIDWQRGSHQ